MDDRETLPEKATAPTRQQRGQAEAAELREGWRKLGRAATIVAILTSPAVFVWFDSVLGWSALASLAAAIATVIIFRGFFDVVTRWMIPWPSTFGIADPDTLQNEVVARRRLWWWRSFFKLWIWLILIGIVVYLIGSTIWGALGTQTQTYLLASLPSYALSLPMLFLVNILILFGPFLAMSISQIKAYEPGDADWGVRLDDVRGQAEAKEEVRRVVSLWESGEQFEKAGGKRERGLLMLGAPGTGKTMLSKAVATGFNCPFVSIPGSGFAGMFIGMDILTVRYLAWKAKRLARKWGGQCIVFIDEIDAVGMRRASLGTSMTGVESLGVPSIHDFCFYGPNGALTSSGDLVIETREWRDRLFAARAEHDRAAAQSILARVNGAVDRIVAPGGMFGQGSGALNSLLVVMDGIGGPPFWRRFWVNRLNTWMDAVYVIPQRIGGASLRLRRPKPANEQIYFIGACNAPIESLDPALTRPGRMGRHVWFRTPTKDDRKDIFDLYLAKVAHSAELDEERRRDELARITNGYSPAMIEQVCSMALTVAHHEGRAEFEWHDLVEAMTTIESGTAVNVEYVPEETRAVAIHEAGHAVTSHVFAKRLEATRLTIRMRGSALGHYYALEKEERFSSWRHEQVALLIQTLGAMAAEHVFYGENSVGVSGDVQMVTTRAALMVGAFSMAPETNFDGIIAEDEEAEQALERVMKRYEKIGNRIMQRASASTPFTADPISRVLGDPGKRRMAAELLGQAYVAAYATILENREAVEHIADVLVERKEIYGDEVLSLLEECNLRKPAFNELDESSWPKVLAK